MRPEPLVKMANQIAASVPVRADVPAETAVHLRKFWAPVMIDILATEVNDNPGSVSIDVRNALAILRPKES
jgi:hypothetical protein